jgi:hypothetical protein
MRKSVAAIASSVDDAIGKVVGSLKTAGMYILQGTCDRTAPHGTTPLAHIYHPNPLICPPLLPLMTAILTGAGMRTR